jgi:hypothetical protein
MSTTARTLRSLSLALAVLACAAVAALLLVRPAARADEKKAPEPPVKKLIEFGWDEPGTSFLRSHIDQMEQTPFDGCVFHVMVPGAQGQPEIFNWLCWGQRACTETELRPALEDLKATTFRRFTHNFLRFNTAPADIDWFDNFAAVRNNARLAARVAREGKCAGILFDDEEYQGKLFTFPKLRDAKTKSWDEYAAQVRKRGREVMEAMQEGYPDLTVLLTFGHSQTRRKSNASRKPITESSYGLLASFLDGMVDAVRGSTKLIDGYEPSYGYKEKQQFEEGYDVMRRKVLPIVADPAKYAKVVTSGFGVWMDKDWRERGWHVADLKQNYFTPEALEASVRAALQRCDEYVWVYSESPRWWSEPGGPVELPEPYAAALRRARQGLAAD